MVRLAAYDRAERDQRVVPFRVGELLQGERRLERARRAGLPRSSRARFPPSVVPRLGGLFDVARDLQLPPGHARHLAWRSHKAHLADPEIAQDLRADSVREEIHLERSFGT